MISIRVGLVCALVLASTLRVDSAQVSSEVAYQNPSPVGVGSPSVLLKNYEVFKSNQLRSGAPDSLIIPLGYVKGHSRSFDSAAGTLAVDLQTGLFRVDLTGLTAGTFYYVWAVDQSESGNPADDRSLLLSSVLALGGSAKATGVLADKILGLSIDLVVITTDPLSPRNVVASGSVSVLQKLYFSSSILTIQGVRVAEGALTSSLLRFASLVPDIAIQTVAVEVSSLSGQQSARAVDAKLDGAAAGGTPIDVLVKQGSTLFFEKTFSGNGRTCGTCHPANHNLTIDKDFIATLPPNDPLFVAETNPALAQLERPALMRGFGLILENLDGLDDPTNKFVMRSVPHTLGMTVSLIQDNAQPNAPAQMTGWSGDGAPGSGSLRDFATGAVTQHFTKSLARVPNVDFVLPNQHELDAMEAFQLSLGRTADFDLTKLVFQDANVETGKGLFINGSGNPLASQKCITCHANAGAIAPNGLNRNFNSNVEDRPNPARLVQNFPIDGGFGQTLNPDGSRGNRSFNTPSLVEAAETAPFFHNNVETTLENAVGFYSGPEFNNPRAPAGRFSFSLAQNTQIANFLRGLNTLQNIDVAGRELSESLALNGNPQPEVQARLATAFNDTSDVIRVLNEGGIFPSAVSQVTSARQIIVQAQQTANPNQRATLIQSAITTLAAARPLVATVLP